MSLLGSLRLTMPEVKVNKWRNVTPYLKELTIRLRVRVRVKGSLTLNRNPTPNPYPNPNPYSVGWGKSFS